MQWFLMVIKGILDALLQQEEHGIIDILHQAQAILTILPQLRQDARFIYSCGPKTLIFLDMMLRVLVMQLILQIQDIFAYLMEHTVMGIM